MAGPSEAAAIFDQAMTATTARPVARTTACDFSGIRRLVDVRGGQGLLLAAIVQAHPSLRGVLFDRPAVVGATATLEAADVADRYEIVGGDFTFTLDYELD